MSIPETAAQARLKFILDKSEGLTYKKVLNCDLRRGRCDEDTKIDCYQVKE